jgi:rubrerythrin
MAEAVKDAFAETNRKPTRKLKHCTRCSYKWLSSIEPKNCPHCRSPYWFKKRVRNPAAYAKLRKREAEAVA